MKKGVRHDRTETQMCLPRLHYGAQPVQLVPLLPGHDTELKATFAHPDTPKIVVADEEDNKPLSQKVRLATINP